MIEASEIDPISCPYRQRKMEITAIWLSASFYLGKVRSKKGEDQKSERVGY